MVSFTSSPLITTSHAILCIVNQNLFFVVLYNENIKFSIWMVSYGFKVKIRHYFNLFWSCYLNLKHPLLSISLKFGNILTLNEKNFQNFFEPDKLLQLTF